MSSLTTFFALVPLLVLVGVGTLLLAEIIRLPIGRRHPLRVLYHALDCALYLALLALAVPLTGWMVIVWGGLLVAALAAMAVALARSRTASPESVAAAKSPLPPRGDPARRVARRERALVRRTSRPSWFELGCSAALVIAVLVVALLAG